jgi:hypothetical protein
MVRDMKQRKHRTKISTVASEKPTSEVAIEDLAEQCADELIDRFGDDPGKLAAVAAIVRRAAEKNAVSED